ncbi:MAG: prenyltransferase, partial [Cyanobacteria bacterium P01_A01_bin.37]
MIQNELTEWDEDIDASPEAEYEALVRSLRWAKDFGLLFVQCSPAEGERLIKRVSGDISEKTVDVLRLDDEIEDL